MREWIKSKFARDPNWLYHNTNLVSLYTLALASSLVVLGLRTFFLLVPLVFLLWGLAMLLDYSFRLEKAPVQPNLATIIFIVGFGTLIVALVALLSPH